MLAAWEGHTVTVLALRDAGADIHIKDNVSEMCVGVMARWSSVCVLTLCVLTVCVLTLTS